MFLLIYASGLFEMLIKPLSGKKDSMRFEHIGLNYSCYGAQVGANIQAIHVYICHACICVYAHENIYASWWQIAIKIGT